MARTRLALLAALLMVATFPLGASAHEQHQVGTYTVEMGWQSEPALEGVPNAAYLEVRETASGTPLDGLAKTLRTQVSFGGGADFRAGDPRSGRSGADDQRDEGRRALRDRTSVASIRSPRQRVFSPPDRVGSGASSARELRSLGDSVDQTRRIALLGAVLAALALVLSALGLRRSRR